MNQNLTKNSGAELLHNAIKYWKESGHWDQKSNSKVFDESSDEFNEDFRNMENDPVLNILMTALSFQTNLLKEQAAFVKKF